MIKPSWDIGMDRPSWDIAPIWAEWLVCDINGDWLFTEFEPVFKQYIGFTEMGRNEFAGGSQGYKERRP